MTGHKRNEYLRDEELIKQIKERNEYAMESVMQRYSRLLWKIAGSVLNGPGSVQDTEECVADVFIQLWQRPDDFDPSRGSLRAYLSAVARNKAIDRFRKMSRHPALELNEEILGSDPDPSEMLALRERSELLAAAVETLPPAERDIVVRRYCYGQKPREISAAMDIPVKTVYNTLQTSKSKLRAAIAEKGGF